MMQPPPKKKQKKKKKEEDKWLRVRDVGPVYFKLTNASVPCSQTIRNWMCKGKTSYAGNHVKLKFKRKGNLFFTTQAWLESFIVEVFGETL